MHDPDRQMEKKKILARLSIVLYQMSDDQLVALLKLYNELDFKEDGKTLQRPKIPLQGIAGAIDRQLLIARFFLLINQLSEADLIRFMNQYELQRLSLLREFPRVPCHLNLVLAADGRAVNCFAMEISAGGMFLESCEALRMGQSVSICFSLAEEKLALKFKGRVVRLEPGGAGIAFESLTSYQLQIMTDLIKRLQHQAHRSSAEG
jgi:hypothetical protein